MNPETEADSESDIVNAWYKKKEITVTDLFEIDERYHRYLHRISCWRDNQNNDYSYIRQKIIEFVKIDNNPMTLQYKFKMMKYIDGEIVLMTNLCLMNELQFQ